MTPGIGDLEGLEDALAITRLPDSQVNGVDVAVFNYDVDFPVMLDEVGPDKHDGRNVHYQMR